MQTKELTVSAADISLQVKTWGDPDKPVILALHGWLDNAASFDRLAPYFPDYYWVIPDLPGHGRSEYRGAGAEYSIWSFATEIMALVNALELDHFVLVGHSMGGGIASLLAGLFPQRIGKLVLLDVIGTLATAPKDVLDQMRLGLIQRVDNPLRTAGVYTSLEAAVTARAVRGIDQDAARLLGKRGISQNDQGWYWSHDQRLTQKNLLSMTEEQIAPFLQAIDCPVLLLTSREAVVHEQTLKRRAALVKDIRVERFDGGHHQHMEGDIATIVAVLKSFLESN